MKTKTATVTQTGRKENAPSVVIWGVGGHALVAADIFRDLGAYTVDGFLIGEAFLKYASPSLDKPILGGRVKALELLRSGVRRAFVGIGDNVVRLQCAKELEAMGFEMVQAVHPRSVISTQAKIGRGVFIGAGAIINAGSVIGDQAIVNTGAIVDHECEVGAGVHISPGARLAGRVRVGKGTWIGIGATIIDSIEIGAGCIIGAGAAVVKNIPDGVVAYGVPARVKKFNESKTR